MVAASAEATDLWSITITAHRPNLEFFEMSRNTLIVACYLLLAVITFGVHNRAGGRRSVLSLMKSAFWGAIWPIYWLGPIGPLGIIRGLVNFVADVLGVIASGVASLREELLFVYYSVAFLFMPAYQIYLRWDSCVGAGSCLWALLKSLLWGIVWPLYIVIRVFNL